MHTELELLRLEGRLQAADTDGGKYRDWTKAGCTPREFPVTGRDMNKKLKGAQGAGVGSLFVTARNEIN